MTSNENLVLKKKKSNLYNIYGVTFDFRLCVRNNSYNIGGVTRKIYTAVINNYSHYVGLIKRKRMQDAFADGESKLFKNRSIPRRIREQHEVLPQKLKIN